MLFIRCCIYQSLFQNSQYKLYFFTFSSGTSTLSIIYMFFILISVAFDIPIKFKNVLVLHVRTTGGVVLSYIIVSTLIWNVFDGIFSCSFLFCLLVEFSWWGINNKGVVMFLYRPCITINVTGRNRFWTKYPCEESMVLFFYLISHFYLIFNKL